MIRKIALPVFIGLLLGMSGCFPEVESDLQNAINRDDRLLADFLSRNNIDAIETQLGYFYKKEISNEIEHVKGIGKKWFLLLSEKL